MCLIEGCVCECWAAAIRPPAIARIEFAAGRCYLIPMTLIHMTVYRRTRARALVLLVAICLGLAGQFGMAMAASVMQRDVTSTKMSMPAGHCPDCGMRGHAPVTMSNCTAAPCLAAPAILGTGLTWSPRLPPSFPLALCTTGNSLVIRPNLAPPKLRHHS